MSFLRKNFARGTLAVEMEIADIQLTLNAGHNLPTDAGTFRLVIWDWDTFPDPADDSNLEIVTAEYSGVANVYDITRAQEDTSATEHVIGERVALHYTAGVSEDDNNSETKYWGDPDTNGSFKRAKEGNDLVTSVRVAGLWIEVDRIAGS